MWKQREKEEIEDIELIKEKTRTGYAGHLKAVRKGQKKEKEETDV